MSRKLLIMIVSLTVWFNISGAKVNADRLNNLTREFATPHLPWLSTEENAELKVLFAVSLHEARHVVELAQRMSVTLDAVTLELRNGQRIFGITANDDGYYGNIYEGTSESDKQKEFIGKLDNPYETVVIQGVDFKKVSNELQFKLFSKVKEGMGLVLMGCRNIPAGLLKTAAKSNVMDLIGATRDNSQAYDINVDKGRYKLNNMETPRAYVFGTGRILVYNNAAAVHAPFEYRSPSWWSLYENGQAKLMRSLLWASGKLPEKSPAVTMADGKAVIRGLEGAAKLRLRNVKNEILKEESVNSAGQVEFKLPELAGGDYYLDVLQKNNPGYFTVTVEPRVKAALTAENDSVKGFSPIRAELQLDRPLKNGTLKIELADSPNQRVWYRAEVKAGGNTRIPIEVKDYYMPNLAAFLNVEVFENGKPVAVLEKPFYFPVYITERMPLYHDSQWEYNPGGIDRLRTMAEVEAMGFGSLINRIDGERPNVQLYFLQNIRLGAHLFDVSFRSRNSKSEALTFDNYGIYRLKLDGADKELIEKGDPTLSEPERLKRMAEIYVEDIFINKKLDQYPLYLFGLGNECNADYTKGFTEPETKAFREMLQAQYGSIEKLNAGWGRKYASFDEIPHLKPKDAIDRKLYPEYLAHINYVDNLIARFAGYLAEEVAGRFPEAEIGCDGVWNNNYGFNMEKIFAIPRVRSWAPYTRLPQVEQLRSIAKGIRPFSVWGWIMGDNALPEAPWYHLLVSPCYEASWFISGASVGGIKTAADYRSFRPELTDALITLRQGPAQLLNVTPLVSDGIGIWENYESTVAPQLSDPRFTQPTDSALALTEYTYQNGLNFEYIFRNSLEKLPQVKVLFLCGASAVGAREAEAFRDYVGNGGIIVADINPGLMNDGYGMGNKGVLDDLFGAVDPQRLEPARNEKIKINTEFKGKKLVLNSEAKQTPGPAPFAVRQIGKGYAVLLNFTLANAMLNCNDGSYDIFLRNLLAACGIENQVKVEGLAEKSVFRVRRGNGFQLLGFTNRRHASAGTAGGKVSVKLPEKGYVYEVGAGLVGQGSGFDFEFNPVFKLFTVFGEEQLPPVLELPAAVRPGELFQLDLSRYAQGRVLLLQLRDGAGKLIRFRNEAPTHEVIYVDGKARSFPLCFAYSDPKGEYELTLTDMATGLKTVRKITLK